MKGVLQIPLRHFHSDPQDNGSEESSTTLPGKAGTQSEKNSSKKCSSTSTSTSKQESNTARHFAAGTQSGRSRNSNTKRNDQASSSSSRCTTSPRRSRPRHRESTSTRSGRLPRGSSPPRKSYLPIASNNNSRHREEGARDERRSQHRGRDHHGHGSSSVSRR